MLKKSFVSTSKHSRQQIKKAPALSPGELREAAEADLSAKYTAAIQQPLVRESA